MNETFENLSWRKKRTLLNKRKVVGLEVGGCGEGWVRGLIRKEVLQRAVEYSGDYCVQDRLGVKGLIVG